MNPDILTQIILPLALFLIMFGMGLSLKPADFKNVIFAPKAVWIGLIGQMVLLPLVALAISVALNLPPEIAVGLMIIALAPGGATSNMYSYLAKGDVSLSISLTAVTSLVTPFTLPIILAWSMHFFMSDATQISLPVLKTIVQLLAITLVPVVLGMWVLSRWPALSARLETVFKWFSVGFLFLIIALIVLKNKDHMVSYFMQAGIATLLLNISVFYLGVKLAQITHLSRAQATAIGFEVGIQNGTLALVVAGTLLANTTMMIPAVTYSLIMFITGSIYAVWRVRQLKQG